MCLLRSAQQNVRGLQSWGMCIDTSRWIAVRALIMSLFEKCMETFRLTTNVFMCLSCLELNRLPSFTQSSPVKTRIYVDAMIRLLLHMKGSIPRHGLVSIYGLASVLNAWNLDWTESVSDSAPFSTEALVSVMITLVLNHLHGYIRSRSWKFVGWAVKTRGTVVMMGLSTCWRYLLY